MAALRRIYSWFPLLQRPCGQSCQRAVPTTRTLLHAPHHAAAARSVSPLQFKAFAVSARGLRNTDDFGSGRHAGFSDEDAEEDEDFIDDSEVEELFQQQVPAGIGEGHHRVFIVHPDVKWGSKKQYLTTGNRTGS